MSIKQTLQAILEALQANDNNRLWTYDDLKRFFNCESTKLREIISQDDFPIPVRPTSNSNPLYLPDDVKQWAFKKRG
jgi:hypothetical protein